MKAIPETLADVVAGPHSGVHSVKGCELHEVSGHIAANLSPEIPVQRPVHTWFDMA